MKTFSLTNPAYVALLGTGPAEAFITASAITDGPTRAAIRTLVGSLLSTGLWYKARAIYPYVGATAFRHSLNLKDPRDADDAFRLTYGATACVHNGAGIVFGGSNEQAADTHFNPAAELGVDNALGVFITQSNVAGTQVDIGCFEDGHLFDLLAYLSGLAYFENDGGGMMYGSVSTDTGFTLATRTAANLTTVYKDGVSIGTSTAANNGYPNRSVTIGNRGGQAVYPSSRVYGLGWIGDGLTASEVAALSTIVHQFQADLGR